MLALLFLLLPVAAASSWYMGRKSAQQDKQQQEANCFAGISCLLSNQQDNAVDLSLNMLKEHSNAVEAHLTLGNLFRSCGEVDRAIRIHRAFMDSISLTFEQRLLAIQQLGKDYMVAGFYDRAEDMFSQLVNEKDFRVGALSLLLQIYQATSEWSKAIDVAEKLVKLGKEQRRVEIAHFYCELALQAIDREDIDRAILLLKKGATADKNSARVSIIRARIFIDQQDYNGAVSELTRVLDQDQEMISETLPMLQLCYHALNQATAWVEFLELCVEKNTGSEAELLLTDIIEREQGPEVAQGYINQQLRQHPTMRMFHRLIDFHLSEAEDGRAKESLLTLRDMVGEQIHTKPRYRCQKCGFTSYNLYWHCPSCKSWASVKPIRGLDGQ
ncbi:lipopolysaccharide assembly protein LapB [Candidatus Hoaglandella endobia]|uniref:Lipopolysaccharide assembly protein B n=1 Tax=Candidatus Hoaglandella endobia TaxID=1778263 RepID=A0A143WTQ3_9ENTR|nr:lipopolysaccharide assembly protein LapB [Candidatus Hoaglandella endobia]CUX96986.1 tetratricopeptide repeat protein [Candidatus Hoaglandella endobia]